MCFSIKCTIFIISLILFGKNQCTLDFRNISIKYYQQWCNLTKYFSFDKTTYSKESTFFHVIPPGLLVKNISLQIKSPPSKGGVFSDLQLEWCRNKELVLQRRPLLQCISLRAGITRNIVRQTILKIASSILQAREGSYCLDKLFKVCPEPVLGHLRVQEKTSVTWAIIVVLLQSYLLHRDLAKVLKGLKNKILMIKFVPQLCEVSTLQLKYPFKKTLWAYRAGRG